MIQIDSFTFNPFYENTYLLFDDSKQCVIIDPGCYDEQERQSLLVGVKQKSLNPVKLLNTHCHIDHVFGNKFISDTYQLGLEIHKEDLPVLDSLLRVADIYQLNVEESPQPTVFLKEGDKIKFGNSELDILFTPGHSPGSICFVSHAQKFVIGGDVLFQGSIGRTDLPLGDHETLIKSIKEKLMTLPGDYKVYPGHGPSTTIGVEKRSNPFLI